MTVSTDVGRLLAEFGPGKSIYLPGATGQLTPLVDALQADPDRADGVEFVGCFVPGMNEVDYAGLHPNARATTFMLPRAMHGSFAAGRVDLAPASYFEAAKQLARRDYSVVFAHVAPPGPDGMCSLGIASDFSPIVWAKAERRVLVVNPLMPAMARGPRLALSDADVVVEMACPLVEAAPAGEPSAEIDAIARRVAALVPDGAAIQTGIGGAPGAIWAHLRDRRGLRLRSGMANDWLRDLAEAGALAPAEAQFAGIAFGSADFYAYLAETHLVGFGSVFATHDPQAIAQVDRFYAINSALEVDLFGQSNVEWQSGRLSSGVGGALDFARGAMGSPGGRSIIALPATAKKGAISRIVARLETPCVSLSRQDVDTVVTEHGVAHLRGVGLDARAEALIAIAAPEFRDQLQSDWANIRGRM